jgi:hypothetical protein
VGSTPVAALAARRLSRAPAGAEPALGAVPSALATAGLLVLFAACVMLVAARTYNPFIYFQF